MIYLHCGWPKTGTTSLQAVLAKQRDRLEDAGIVYPDRWHRDGDDSHNGLTEMLSASPESGPAAFDGLKALVAVDAGRDLLLSSESLATWLLTGEMHQALLGFLAVAAEVAPVKCVWTLRRFDDVVHSLCVQMALAGIRFGSPAEFLRRRSPSLMFTGMRRVEAAVDNSAYVKYESGGEHLLELMGALGLPAGLATILRREVEDGPRLNTSHTHKETVAVLNADALSSRTGIAFDRRALLTAFDREGFRFENDCRCELAGQDVRQDLHERALAAAQESGLTSYMRFFGDDDLSYPSDVDIGPDALDEDDLGRLMGQIRV